MKLEDLQLYFKRIGFEESPKVDFKTLAHIVDLHSRIFPFENLTPFLGLPVHLDSKSLTHKFLIQQRGGYCFEQNQFLTNILEKLGFQTERLLGKVCQSGKQMQHLQRTHQITLVLLEGKKYIVDVGFGGLCPTTPIEFVLNKEQKTDRESYRIVKERAHYVLEIFFHRIWKPLYIFDFQEQYDPDFKVANWYTSTHPDSSFTHQLKLAIAAEDGRYVLFNNKLTFYSRHKRSEVTFLKNLSEIKEVLEDKFLISLEGLTNLEERLLTLIA